MIKQGVSLAGHGFPARMQGAGLATDGMVMRAQDVLYPIRVALSVSYRGAGVTKSYRGVSVGVTE